MDDADAIAWKKSLDEFVSVNPDVDGGFFSLFSRHLADFYFRKGSPANNKQFFGL